MSGTVATPSLAARILEWSRPIVAFLTVGLFAVAFVAAIVMKNEQILLILVGAVVSGFSTITGYYFGSSSGSEKKDATIAAQLTPEKPAP